MFLQILFSLFVSSFIFDLSSSESRTPLKWQVEVGKRYEVIATNSDGLWRYRLNDIVEVSGFTPAEGIPLVRYVERKGCAQYIST